MTHRRFLLIARLPKRMSVHTGIFFTPVSRRSSVVAVGAGNSCVCVERKTLNVRDAGCIAVAATVFEAKECQGVDSGRGAEILNCGIVVSNCHYSPIETSFCGKF